MSGPIFFAAILAVAALMAWWHWKDFHTLRWWAAAVAFYVGWALFLAFVPGHTDMAWPWMFIDAPLNFGWAFCLVWPAVRQSWVQGRAQREHLRAQIRFLRETYREYRRRTKEMQ